MKAKERIDKASKLLDLLDKHIKEENCRHSPTDLLQEYKKSMIIEFD
jgi:hypothetical protein